MCIISILLSKIIPSMVEPHKDLQVPSMGPRISVQVLFIVSLTCGHLASGSVLTLFDVLRLLNTYHMQCIVLRIVGETKMIKTQFWLSRSLSSIWADRQEHMW